MTDSNKHWGFCLGFFHINDLHPVTRTPPAYSNCSHFEYRATHTHQAAYRGTLLCVLAPALASKQSNLHSRKKTAFSIIFTSLFLNPSNPKASGIKPSVFWSPPLGCELYHSIPCIKFMILLSLFKHEELLCLSGELQISPIPCSDTYTAYTPSVVSAVTFTPVQLQSQDWLCFSKHQ